MIFSLAQDFHDAVTAMPREHPKHRMLELLEEAIRRDIHFIGRHPTTLFQCMWNTCWWYDCREAADHYKEHEGYSNEPPPWERTGLSLHDMVHAWRAEKTGLRACPRWVRSHRPPLVQLGGPQLAVFSGQKNAVVISVGFSPDGSRIVSGAEDGLVRVWDAGNGEELAILRGHKSLILCVAFSPDGLRLVSASEDHTIRVWDAQIARELVVFRGHTAGVEAVAFSPCGGRIASASTDYTIRIWDVAKRCELLVVHGHEGGVNGVAWSPDGCQIASASNDQTVRLWDAQSGSERAIFRGHSGGVNDVAFSPDGRELASASFDGSVRVWDVERKAQILECWDVRDSIRSVAYSPEGRRIASPGSGDVLVWDAKSGAILSVLEGHQLIVDCVAFSSDGGRLVSGSHDGTVRVWNAHPGPKPYALRGHSWVIQSTNVSPDGGRIVTGSRDATLRIWDATTGVELAVYNHGQEVERAWFSADGRHVVGWSTYWGKVWDAQSGVELTELKSSRDGPNHTFTPMSVSDDPLVRPMQEATETLFQDKTTSCPLAWFPSPLRLNNCPLRQTWAGNRLDDRHLVIVSLETVAAP